jgi:uncharacterized protein (TIGR02679 family)
MTPEDRQDLVAIISDPAFDRMLRVLHDSLVRHGEPKGQLEILTYEEAGALGGLVGKRLKPPTNMKLAEIDRRLQNETRFHCSLLDLVELHHGEPLVRPKVVRQRLQAERDRAVKRCFEALPGLKLSPRAYTRVVSWMHAAENDLRAGFRHWGEAKLIAAVRTVAQVFDRTAAGRGGPTAYLAELAAEVAGGSHGLDHDHPAGTLLFRALAYHYPETAQREVRRSAAWRAALLADAGIARDRISVRVDTFGLMGDTPYFAELRKAGVDRPFTLNSLSELGEHARAWRQVAFVVENPTVFMALMKQARRYAAENYPTLICTNGNLNLAEWELLDVLVSNGTHLFYSGDFDPSGLEIAATVLRRYPDHASTWRLTPADYAAAIRPEGEKFSPGSLQRVSRWFPDLVAAMQEHRFVAFQETIIPMLERDLHQFVMFNETPPRGGRPPQERGSQVGEVPI